MGVRSHRLLEIDWAEFNGLHPDNVVACSSGTAALHLAMEAVRETRVGHNASAELIKNEVITNDFSMIACPRSVVMAGLTPVFVDCDDRLLMRDADFRSAKRFDSRAVLVVHVYGRRQDMDFIHRESEPRGLLVVEDLAEAHGIRPHPDSFAACWSFYANKIVAGEEGGAVWFRDRADAERARSRRCLGFTADHDYTHDPRGCNYRLADSLADKILDSLEWAGLNLSRRKEVARCYDRLLPDRWKMPPRDVDWVYDLRLHGCGQLLQGAVVKALRENGIEARHGFKPCHRQCEFDLCRMASSTGGCNANSVWASQEVIYLPCHPGVNLADVSRAVEIIGRMTEGLNPLK